MRPLFVLYLSLISALVYADEPVSTGYFNKVAIGGHDTVAYHHLQHGDEAVKGEKAYIVDWKGAKWRFLRHEDAKKFTQNPERYAPAYNGHCANALSLGEGLIKTSGKHWLIFDDQLYLFFAPRGAKRWLDGNYVVYKAAADQAWQRMTHK